METVCGRRVLGSTRLLRAFAEAGNLSRGARLCYLVMAAYGRDSGECYASSTTLAKDLRASRRAVKRWWWELRQAGWIHPQWVPGKPTHHVFPWHPIFAEASPTGDDKTGIPPMPKPAQGGDRIVTQMKRTYIRGEKSSSATTQLHEDVRSLVWSYFQGDRKYDVPPPDRDIVRRCVVALHGHSSEELRLFLNAKIRQGFGAGRGKGPRDYTWFPTVIDNAFRPRQ